MFRNVLASCRPARRVPVKTLCGFPVTAGLPVRRISPPPQPATGRHAMHTIALVSKKGGTGKSTLAIGLATAALADGHKVCLLETDPQGTVSHWRRRRMQAEPAVETVNDGSEIERRLPFLANCGVTL